MRFDGTVISIRCLLKATPVAAAALLVGMIATSAYAQMPAKFGAKAGLNIGYFEGGDGKGSTSLHGWSAGVFTNLGLFGRWSFQPEVMYTQKGAKVQGRDDLEEVITTIELNYFEIPVLLKYSMNRANPISPYLITGPALAFISRSRTTYETIVQGIPLAGSEVNYNQRPIDLSLVLGAGIDFDLGPRQVIFDVRFTKGLRNVWDSVDWADVPPDQQAYAHPDGKADYMRNFVVSVSGGVMF